MNPDDLLLHGQVRLHLNTGSVEIDLDYTDNEVEVRRMAAENGYRVLLSYTSTDGRRVLLLVRERT